MSDAWQFYISTLLVFTGVNVIACLALNLQFGVAGILNFAFIVFQAAGAYVASVVTLGPSSASGGLERYILGTNLPWPVPVALAAAAGALLAFLVGLFALRPRRPDYQAMVLLTVSIIATTLVTDEVGWFNGPAGLVGVPRPLGWQQLGLVDFGWSYVALTAVVMLLVYFFVNRLTGSPWGREVRALRTQPLAAEALGVNVYARRMQAFVCGGTIAAISGAVLVEFLGAWSTSSWQAGETFVYLVAIVVGGVGSNLGAALGAAIVLTVVIDGLQYLPFFSFSPLAGAIQLIILGVAIIVLLWFKPNGLVPARGRRFSPAESSRRAEDKVKA